MTRSRDLRTGDGWRMYCDEDKCQNRSEAFPTEPPLHLFAERGWFIAKLFGDVCPQCLADGVKPSAEQHPLKYWQGVGS